MEEPPPTTPQKTSPKSGKRGDHSTHPSNSINTKKPKSLYQTNQILKFFYPKYRLCCLTVVRDAGEATVTPFDATTTSIFTTTFL